MTCYLSLKLALEYLRYKRLLFIRKRHTPTVVERSLGHVVQKTVKELLGVTLLADHKVFLSTDFVQQLDANWLDLVTIFSLISDDSSYMTLEDTEGAILIRSSKRLGDHSWAFDFGLGQQIVCQTLSVDHKFKL